MEKKVGQYAFMLAAVLAVVVGILSPFQAINQQALQWLVSILVILGLVVGFLNITAKEKKDFLLAGVIFIIAALGGAADILGNIFANLAGGSMDFLALGKYLRGIFQAMLAVVIPAVVIVAGKMLWDACKDR